MTIQTNKKIEFLQSFLHTKLSKDELNISIWCPYCRNSNKSKLKLVVHLEKNIYHCWVCNKKGTNIPELIKKIDYNKFEISKNIFKTRNKSKNFNFLFEDIENIEKEEEIVNLPSDFKLLAFDFNSTDPDIRDTFNYAIKRGFNKHKMFLLRAGTSKERDFRRTLILPSIDKNGKLNFYTSRKIDVNTKNSFKYNNASVQKKNVIFNEININWEQPLTLVEGPLDLIKTNDNATCLLGSSLNETMYLFQQIVKHKTDVYLALDKDAYFKAIKIAELLTRYDVNVSIVDTRIADDVGDMTHDQFKKELNDAKKFSKQDSLLTKIKYL